MSDFDWTDVTDEEEAARLCEWAKHDNDNPDAYRDLTERAARHRARASKISALISTQSP